MSLFKRQDRHKNYKQRNTAGLEVRTTCCGRTLPSCSSLFCNNKHLIYIYQVTVTLVTFQMQLCSHHLRRGNCKELYVNPEPRRAPLQSFWFNQTLQTKIDCPPNIRETKRALYRQTRAPVVPNN